MATRANDKRAATARSTPARASSAKGQAQAKPIRNPRETVTGAAPSEGALLEIATFVEVMRAETLTEAAKRLGVPKSTVSRRLSRLEAALETRLVRRTARKVIATEAGTAYYERVAPAIDMVFDAARKVRDDSEVPRGIVRLSVPVDVGNAFLPDLLLDFSRAYPEIQVHVDLAQRRVDLVREGIDLAMRAGPVGDDTMIARRLASVDAGLFAAPKYLAERGVPERPEDLARHETVRFIALGERHWPLTNDEGDTVQAAIDGRFVGNEFNFIRQMTVRGAGIALFPLFLGQQGVKQGTLARVLPRWRLPGAVLNLVYPSARYLPARVAVFRDFAIDWIKRGGWER